jgi:hypothetical protein
LFGTRKRQKDEIIRQNAQKHLFFYRESWENWTGSKAVMTTCGQNRKISTEMFPSLRKTWGKGLKALQTKGFKLSTTIHSPVDCCG